MEEQSGVVEEQREGNGRTKWGSGRTKGGQWKNKM